MMVTGEGKGNKSGTGSYPEMVAGTDFELTEEYALDTESADEQNVGWLLVRELVETVVLSLIIFLAIRVVVQNFRIESHSMEPNFYEGQFILVNKLAYRFGEPNRGDVIVFRNPNNTDEDYIKRVIGLPGDTLEIRNQDLIINGDIILEPYPLNAIAPNTYFGPIVVPPNDLFVMGDNRPNSRDSRSFGPLSEDLIIGKTWVRVFPFSKFGPIKHYDVQSTVAANSSP